ncbi:hypothetical protein BH11PSE14_BH11PSE14_13570 [soil metagenome]
MTPARAGALAALAALIGVQWLWQRPALTAAVFSLPLLLVALRLASKRPNSWFWAGLASLPYFCHGIVEAWAMPGVRIPAVAEALLAFALAMLVSWDGMRARFAAKAAAKAAAAGESGSGPTG